MKKSGKKPDASKNETSDEGVSDEVLNSDRLHFVKIVTGWAETNSFTCDK